MLHNDDHDRGLVFDLQTLVERRRLFGILGAAGAGLMLSGCNPFGGPPSSPEANVTGTFSDGTSCIKDPGETAGPFPGDGTNSKSGQTVNVLTQSGVVRQDMRTSFDGMSAVAAGTQLDVTLTLVDVSAACAPLAGHAVYLWHCDADGKYSLYDLPDRNYLRAVGITDTNGQVKLTTIFPGCYSGRWPHMHFEIFKSEDRAASGEDSLLISQFAMPEAESKALYASNSTYAASVASLAATSLNSDLVFSDNTPEQVAAQMFKLTGDAEAGFQGSVTIGIASL